MARIIGYEHVGMSFLNAPLPPQRHFQVYDTEEKIRDIFGGGRAQEIINRTLTTPEDHDKLRVGQCPLHRIGESAGPRAAGDAPFAARQRAMENLARNLRYSEQLMTFEVGRVRLSAGRRGWRAAQGRSPREFAGDRPTYGG